jgi:2-keto-4-pentenoate hydratase
LIPVPDARGHEALVQALLSARQHGAQAIAEEWSQALSDAGGAYAVQDAVAEALGWFAGSAGDAPRYWKSGGASRQATLTHAALPPEGVRSSPADLRGWPLHTRGIEAEVVLRLGEDVDAERAATLTAAAVETLVDAMAVSIEVVDSRWREGPQAPALLRLADLQSHGALVLGEWQPYARRDWSVQRCDVRIAAGPPATFKGSYALGDPTWLLTTWLRHATRKGAVVRAGTIVTTGTWCGLLQAQAGDRVEVAFEGVGAAALQL